MSESPKIFRSSLINIFAGAGMGLLVGLIVGLSVSPVVSVILGALASLLAAFLGLQPGGNTEGDSEGKATGVLSKMQENGLKAGSFGLACVIGILLGLFIRNQNLFVPTVSNQLAQYTQAGFKEDYARQLIVLEKFGIDPETGTMTFGEMQKSKTSALYAKKGEKDFCDAIDPERFRDVAELLKSYRRQESTTLSELADVLDNLDIPEADKLELMTALKEVICE
ncbi:MAG: hypothetical protein D6748_14590 [Calditrichaeota bacterium]|nr:MAG: hypothetical protein D6748_14590 [Calditrichota bacterium]